MTKITNSERIAGLLLQIKAIGFAPETPIQFKSGMLSPVYVDNRKLPFFPEVWQEVVRGMASVIESEALKFDVIAGIETAGIPHSAALSYVLQKPSVFVRKKIKDHGTKSRIEGGEVGGKTVLLIEDHVTTGGSSLAGVTALREDGARVTDCVSITSYAFTESVESFEQASVKLHTLTDFESILKVARAQNLIEPELKASVEAWMRDPWGWGEKHGKK